jgi:uncharacterized protein
MPAAKPVRRSVPSTPRAPTKRSLKQRLANPMRWLHIYSSMFGLVAILFFSVTGLTLNHPTWTFGSVSKEETQTGQMPGKWLKPDVSKLEVVEHLRKENRVRGLVDNFTIDDTECSITLKGPAYSADIFLNRETGSYEVTQRYAGLTAFMNDLHKGRDSGKAWSLVIDLSAVILIIVSLTGIALLLYIKRRRGKGFLATVGGFAVLAVIIWLCVP